MFKAYQMRTGPYHSPNFHDDGLGKTTAIYMAKSFFSKTCKVA